MLWEEKNYDDIIDLPHHVSENHAHMSIRGRAAQFSAFAALKGYDEAVAEAARRTDSRREPDEDTAREINERLVWLIEHLAELPRVELTYFVADERRRRRVCARERCCAHLRLIRERAGIRWRQARADKRYLQHRDLSRPR